MHCVLFIFENTDSRSFLPVGRSRIRIYHKQQNEAVSLYVFKQIIIKKHALPFFFMNSIHSTYWFLFQTFSLISLEAFSLFCVVKQLTKIEHFQITAFVIQEDLLVRTFL